MVTQYYFRDFRLDPAARELRQGERAVALPASAFDGLVYLIEHRARAVGRDELIAAIWGRVDVSDTLLAQTILRIRRELGDSGAENSAIRTVPRFGYQWVEETHSQGTPPETLEPVRPVIEATVPVSPSLPHDAEPAPRDAAVAEVKSRWRWILPAGVVAIALVVLLVWWYPGQRPSEPEAGAEMADQSVAAYVLAAKVPDLEEWRWLRLGLMDLIATRLRSGGLVTAPSETVIASVRQDGTVQMALPDALAVQPVAEFQEGQWRVLLTASNGDASLSVEASASDVLAAARIAVDELLIRLGRAPLAASDGSDGLALQELLQRTRAAILADQFELARSLIAQSPEALQRSPEIGLRLAQIDMGQGNYAAAQAVLERLLDRSADTALSPSLHGRILSTMGGVHLRRGDLVSARHSYTEAVRVLQGTDDSVGLGQAYVGLGAVAANQGDTDSARAHLGRARVALEAGGDPFAVAQVDLNLGLIASRRRRPAEALPVLRDAIERFVRLGAQEEQAYARYALIGVQLQLLDLQGARATSDAAWPARRHTGNARVAWELTLMRAQVLLEQGELEEADRLLARLEQEADPELDGSVRLAARAQMAMSAWAKGNDAQAASLAQAALVPGLEQEHPNLYLATWRLHLKALRRMGRHADAAEGVAALRNWVSQHDDEVRQVLAILAGAEQAWADGARQEALAGFDEAAARADQLGIPELKVEAGVAQLHALLASGLMERASAVAGALAPWAQRDFRAAAAEARLFHALGRDEAWHRAVERTRVLAGQRTLSSVLPDADVPEDTAKSGG